MRQLILSVGIGALLFSASAEARSCRDEPERCPILRWNCIEPVSLNAQNYTYLSATITSSFFSSTNSLIVKEHFCSRTPQLICRERNSQERWYLYPRAPNGQLMNQMTGQKIILNCSEYKEDTF